MALKARSDKAAATVIARRQLVPQLKAQDCNTTLTTISPIDFLQLQLQRWYTLLLWLLEQSCWVLGVRFDGADSIGLPIDGRS